MKNQKTLESLYRTNIIKTNKKSSKNYTKFKTFFQIALSRTQNKCNITQKNKYNKTLHTTTINHIDTKTPNIYQWSKIIDHCMIKGYNVILLIL